MGRQIAMTAALAGYRTTVQDISQDMLDAASAEMSGWAESRVPKGKLEQATADAALTNLVWETDLERAAANADFVIEAATERPDIKRGIFESLGSLAPQHAILATNCGAGAIYLYGGRPGIVALARYAGEFVEIDDPDALDYGGTSAEIEIDSIGVMRNEYGHVLCKVVAIEPTVDYGGTGHVSVTINWEVRIGDDKAA